MYILPMAFLFFGLVLGGGLFFVSHRLRGRLKTIEDAKPCTAGSPVAGLVKLHGTVKAVDPSELLISPMDQIPCVYYKLVIDQFQQSLISISNGSHATSRHMGGNGSWHRIIEDVQAIPMVIADETGAVAIDPREATLDFQQSRAEANLLSSLPADLEESLKTRYKIATKSWFMPNQMRYTEVVITEGQEVFAVGTCEVNDGKATLTRKDGELMMTFRSEEQVLRNSKISSTICTVAAIVIPLAFIAIAGFLFIQLASLPSHPTTNQNAVKNGNQNTPVQPKNAQKRR